MKKLTKEQMTKKAEVDCQKCRAELAKRLRKAGW